MSTKIKTSAIIAAGYVYQTMQGVNLLCDWLDAPTRYARIRFECDEDAIAPQGLDDLVAERPDGRIDLWQVKFTPSPAKHALDWKWLLEKKGKAGGTARTNLRKWFDALDAIEPAKVGDIRLLTNRVPDLAMETCLAGGAFIDYTLAPADIQKKVEQDLGGAANAVRLFQALEVMHSDKGFSSIETHLTQRLRRHSTVEGIETLKNRAVHWSIEKNQPAPDGWITFKVLQATLRVIAPEPLPEDFVIPLGYRVPDTGFHTRFMAALKAAPKQPVVLTGPPGRGKSTYLSKVCELLQKGDIPFVRHHYYLSANDRTRDRYTSFAVQESLLAQVKEFHNDVVVHDRALAPALMACAAHYRGQGMPFVVILDGLDHVWRSQGYDKRSLDEVFNQLLPACDNLVLVVGTQPVEDAQLPNRLLIEAPRGTWLELPAMSADAVLQYLRKEVQQGRLQLRTGKPMAETELQAAAAKLRERTSGHPLHVIYATEELVRSGQTLSVWSVEKLSGDMSRDAKTYYSSLWHLLTASQKDVLRLVCAFPFFWPKHAFTEIAVLSSSPRPEVTAVEHLLHASSAGLRPFHESLIVYVRQTDTFEQRVDELAAFVEAWLDTTAPTALRVNWLWSVKAKRGHPDELIAGLQRDWVLERLQEGYPTDLFENLLDEAEELAVQRTQYADAYRLRHLKYRLLNSLSYQLMGEDAARLKACTWTLAPDGNVIDEAFASRHETTVVDVAALGLALAARGNGSAAKECAQDALRRHRGESRFATQNQGSEAQGKMLYLARAFAELNVLDSTTEKEAQWIAGQWPPMAHKRLEALVDSNQLRRLVEISVALPEGESKLMVCDAAFRAAALAEVDLAAWTEFPAMSRGILVGCLNALARGDVNFSVRPLDYKWQEGGYEESREALSNLAHDWFFGSAHLELTAGKNVSTLRVPKFKNRENVSSYLDQLGSIGREFAERWAAGHAIKFSQLYQAFSSIKFSGFDHNYNLGQGASDFRRALHGIAVDIQLMSTRFGQAPLVEVADLQLAMKQVWFDTAEFRKQYVSGCAKVLSDGAAEAFIRHQLSGFDADNQEETGIRMMAMLELCEMAIRHDIAPLAVDLCRRTWELALGYAQRKDPALSEVMDALEYLMPVEPHEARRLLVEVAPQVHNVLAYTDGKGTRHVLAQADDLLANLDRGALVEKCRKHTECSDWSEAENCLRAFLRTAKTQCEFTSAVLRTGIHLEAIESLQVAADSGDAIAAKMLAEVEQHRGGDVGRIDEQSSKGSDTDWKPFLGDVKTYPITDLPRLTNDLKEHFGVRADVLCEWYVYWEAQGQGSQLIGALEPILLSDSCRDNDLSDLLDLAFATKLRLEGPAKAFPYIVQAQLFRGGWLRYYMEPSEKTQDRLRQVVKTYRRRCDEFFLKSTYGWLDRPKRTRVIPSDMMVYFLGLQGRTTEAVQFAEAMVRCVQEDTRTLCLSVPSWAEKLPDLNVELEMLMLRLRWPIAATRWWAMQELASLLLSPSSHAEVCQRLLSELRLCRLEAETVELLSIFWMAFNRGWVVVPDLGAAVRHPSLLTERLLDDMGQTPSSNITQSLKVAPRDFEVPIGFERVQGTSVPRIYLTLMNELEQQSNLPFTRQFAFEWSLTEAAYPDAPLQGDLVYFVRPAGDKATGGFACRTLLRMLTAFQRTLEVARKLWRMPNEIAFHYACYALPLEPTLAFLRPARPLWMPQLSLNVVKDNTSVAAFINEAQSTLTVNNPGAVLLAMVTPVVVSAYEIIELSVVRWRMWGNRPIDADSLAARFDSRQKHNVYGTFDAHAWGTRSHVSSLELDDVLDEETQSAPMATIHAVNRVGYLQKDLYPKRLYLPVITGHDGEVAVDPSAGELTVSIEGKLVATSVYWNAGWSPGHPTSISGLCGTALVGEVEEALKEGDASPDGQFYLWTLTRLRRQSGYGAFDEDPPIYGILMQ
ncbi:ATP-binding protein [Janthinobacterium sp. MDT1-19]|uniref:ATP-binding protein n=1 Tax=Janthinobacterium sp. MDT1-19 TaxID=1259339 RepID=UPI003F206C6A